MNNNHITLTEKQIELASKLTDLKRKFVIEMIKPGSSQRQAYIDAGGKASSKKAQEASASRMFNDKKVKALYDDIMSSRQVDAILNRNEALAIVAEIAKDTSVAPNHRVQAVKQAAEMEGWNAPKKQELTGKDGDSLEIKANVTSSEIASALSDLMNKL